MTSHATLLYNLVMAVVDVAVLTFFGHRRQGSTWVAGMAIAGSVALGLAAVRGEDHFGVWRLVAYGVFLHGTLVLAGSAVLFWRQAPAVAVLAAGLAGLLLIFAADAFLVEPSWLEVSHRQIVSEKIDRPLRIVVLADLQADRIGRYEREAFRRVVEEKPDLVLLVGDYVQTPWNERQAAYEKLNALLQELHLGQSARVFAVQGNVDWPDWNQMFRGLAVTAVRHTQSFDLDGLRLTCLSLADSCQRGLTLANRHPDRFHVVLGHVPDFALGRIDADLLIAGHTHGGQIRLPWIGAVTTHSRIPSAWAAGLTELPGGARLLVSRGVGMERKNAPRLRFNCRPELAVIDLVPASQRPSVSVTDP